MSEDKCFCHFNGFAVKDATARKDIEALKEEDNSIREDVQAFKEDVQAFKEDVQESMEAGDLEKVGKKTEEGGEIFNDYDNNKALGEGSSASGLNTQAGTKAFKILSIEPRKVEDHSVYDLTVYDITIRGNVLEGTDPYVIGDLLQIEGQNHQNNSYKIRSISEDGSVITAEKVDGRMCGAPKYSSSDPNKSDDNPDNWLYVVGKNIGIPYPQSVSGHAGGEDTIASGRASFAHGRNLKVTGNYGASFGSDNVSAYAGFSAGVNNEAGLSSVALGGNNKATGLDCVAMGEANQAPYYASVALGSKNKSRAYGSVALGNGCITSPQDRDSNGNNGEGQVMLGKFNREDPSIAFAVGNGTDDNNRSNIFEVYKDGSVSVDGVKTTKDEISVLKTLPSDVTNLKSRVNELARRDMDLGSAELDYYNVDIGTSVPYCNIALEGLAKYEQVLVNELVPCHIFINGVNHQGAEVTIIGSYNENKSGTVIDNTEHLMNFHSVKMLGYVSDVDSNTITLTQCEYYVMSLTNFYGAPNTALGAVSKVPVTLITAYKGER